MSFQIVFSEINDEIQENTSLTIVKEKKNSKKSKKKYIKNGSDRPLRLLNRPPRKPIQR